MELRFDAFGRPVLVRLDAQGRVIDTQRFKI